MTRARVLCSGLVLLVASCARSQRSPTPDANLAVFNAYVRAWNAHDTLALDSLLAPGGIHEDLAQGFRGATVAEINAFLAELLKAEPDFQWQITSAFAYNSHVSAEWTWTSTYTGPSPLGPLTNRRISGRGASVAEIENGKIKRFTDYYDNASYFR